MRKKQYSNSVMILCLSCIMCLSLCSCNEIEYQEYKGIWYSEVPFIELNCAYYKGNMILDGVKYRLCLSYANDGSYIEIDDQSLVNQIEKDENGNYLSGITEDMLLWQADTVVKEGKLYLTVTKDNISDYEGKTIELKLRPYKEGEDAYPEEE